MPARPKTQRRGFEYHYDHCFSSKSPISNLKALRFLCEFCNFRVNIMG